VNLHPRPLLHNQSVSFLAPVQGEEFPRGFYIVGDRIEQRIAGPFRTEKEADMMLASGRTAPNLTKETP
jgi:hypothetical protein